MLAKVRKQWRSVFQISLIYFSDILAPSYSRQQPIVAVWLPDVGTNNIESKRCVTKRNHFFNP